MKHGERKKELQNEKSISEPWGNLKQTNICIIGVSKGEERERGTEKIFKDIVAKNFP